MGYDRIKKLGEFMDKKERIDALKKKIEECSQGSIHMQTEFIKNTELEATFLQVNHFPWGKDYCPMTTAKIWFESEIGFHVIMQCQESHPLAVYQNPDEPVYEDSCMECFLQFYPEESEIYMNFEVNSNGIMLCQKGTGRRDRIFIRNMGFDQPKVTLQKTESSWKISYVIPLELIGQVYGRCDFVSGQILRGNFYKCGDKTEIPHYGCWNLIGCDKPDYHRPEYFGSLMLI